MILAVVAFVVVVTIIVLASGTECISYVDEFGKPELRARGQYKEIGIVFDILVICASLNHDIQWHSSGETTPLHQDVQHLNQPL